MIIGIDFDNTIVNYEGIFYRVAMELNLIPESTPRSKKAVRDYLRSIGNEDAWTMMQGYVYGERMLEAEPFPGVLSFFSEARERGIDLFIVSHKTKYPYKGKQYDLHGAALSWLQHNSFFEEPISLSNQAVFFEPTLGDKLNRIASCRCEVFIDDLPEVLNEAGFPKDTKGILFDPSSEYQIGDQDGGLCCYRAWQELLMNLRRQAL